MTCQECGAEIEAYPCVCGFPPEPVTAGIIGMYGSHPAPIPKAFEHHHSEARSDKHLTKEQFGDVLFECVKACAGRAQIQKTAKLLMHDHKLDDKEKTKRLSDLARREATLHKQIEELFPFLDDDDQARLLHDYGDHV